MAAKTTSGNRYSALVAAIFRNGYRAGIQSFGFSRDDIARTAGELGIALPKNVGDVIYSFRYRNALPEEILSTQPKGHEWIIVGTGKSAYAFKLVKLNRIVPNESLLPIKIPDATPEIISRYALGDEQALLAKVRYNRLIDLFLGVAAYSLQNHLRTTVPGIGQIEIDEVYIAVDKHGRQFVVPVQAKGGKDQHGVVQTAQDVAWCKARLPELICRPVSVQFVSDTKIAMFALGERDGMIGVVDEKHYELVPAASITQDDLRGYNAVAEG